MSLADLTVLLQETAQEIFAARTALGERPDDFAAQINLLSLEKRQASLQDQFDEAAATEQVEVLRYRMVTKGVEAPVKSVGDLISSFQRSFSVVYDALATNVRKTRARIGDESAKASTLSFAYAFPGSLGFALTLPRDLTLLETKHNAAMRAIEDICKVATSEDIREFADHYGIASVRSLFQWFDAISKTELDSEIEWKARDGERERFMVQVPDARAIRNLIDSTSEVETTDKHYWGTLIAYDSVRRTFRFAVADRKAIGGRVTDSISDKLIVPERYNATIRVSTISRYSTEEKEEQFELRAIDRAE